MKQILGPNGEVTNKSDANPLDLSKSTEVKCENCGDVVFQTATTFRRISKVITGTKEDAIIPVEIFVCASCGEIIQELVPPELKLK